MANVGQVKAQIAIAQDCLDRAQGAHADFETDMNLLRLDLRQYITRIRELLQRAYRVRASLTDARTVIIPLNATDQPLAYQAYRQVESALDEAEKAVIALMQVEDKVTQGSAHLANSSPDSIMLLTGRITQAKETLRAWNIKL